MDPVRCLSSRLTSRLLEYRNPQGKEENWINQRETIPSYIGHFGRVVSTELGLAVLTVAATVEAVVLIVQWPFSEDNSVPPKISSAFFTIYWNLGNLICFNLFCTNVLTHESFARYSMDHWPRGMIYRVILITAYIAWMIYSKSSSSSENLRLFAQNSLRTEDKLFLADWIARFPRASAALAGVQEGLHAPHPAMVQLVRYAEGINGTMARGKNFFQETMLADGQVTEKTRTQIVDQYPVDIYQFVLTRCAYLYALGDKKAEEIPAFLKPVTITRIQAMRDRPALPAPLSAEFIAKVQNIDAFGISEDLSPAEASLFSCLKTAASEDLQGSIFITRCWTDAIGEYQVAHPADVPA